MRGVRNGRMRLLLLGAFVLLGATALGCGGSDEDLPSEEATRTEEATRPEEDLRTEEDLRREYFRGVCRGQVPIVDAEERIVLEGFTLLPPSGEEWAPCYFEFLSPDGLSEIGFPGGTDFGRARTHTLSANAYFARLNLDAVPGARDLTREELLLEVGEAFVRERAGEPSPSRYTIIDLQIEPDPMLSPTCVRFDVITEDRGVPNYVGEIFLLVGHGYLCLHPQADDLFLGVEYSERVHHDDPPFDGLEEQGEAFLRGLQFTTPE